MSGRWRNTFFELSLSLSRKNIVENSSVISTPHAVANMLYLDQRLELLLSDNLFNVTDTGPIQRSMAQSIADSGLSYDDLHKLYTRFGKRGLVAILSNPPTTSSAKTPRVTRTKRILAAIVKHFEETSNEARIRRDARKSLRHNVLPIRRLTIYKQTFRSKRQPTRVFHGI